MKNKKIMEVIGVIERAMNTLQIVSIARKLDFLHSSSVYNYLYGYYEDEDIKFNTIMRAIDILSASYIEQLK